MQERINNSVQPYNNFRPESELGRRSEFSKREVGLNHPDNEAFIRLSDDGDIEIFAAPGVGIVISATGRSISLFADDIRFFSKEDGLRWNMVNFNSSAVDFSEPTLLKVDMDSVHSEQNNAEYYLRKLEEINQKEKVSPVTISGEYAFGGQVVKPPLSSSYSLLASGLNEDQLSFVENVLKEYPETIVSAAVENIKNGYTNSQALEKAKEDNNA